MEYLGYVISLVLLFCFFKAILIVSDVISKKIEERFEEKIQEDIKKNKEEVYILGKRAVGGSIESKYLIELCNNFSVLYYINQLIKNGRNKYNIIQLVELINSKYFSEDLFNRDLKKKSVGDLNKINYVLKKDLKKMTLIKNSIVTVILTAVVIPIIQNISCIRIITKNITDFIGNQLYTVVILLSILILIYIGITIHLNKRNLKKISLDSEYIISMIDLVIKEKLK